MKKNYLLLGLIVATLWTVNAQKQLLPTLIDSSKLTDDGLYYDGEQGVNYQFSQRMSPHGDCIDIINGYAFLTWYKGGVNFRNVMLSRKDLSNPNSDWVTIEFPHQHVGHQGTNPTRGDSHNTIAIGVSPIDGTIHMLYDMHSYTSANLPNDFFNYSVSKKNMAFVPDSEFNIDIFNEKRTFLKSGQNYERVTYPMLHRADDGSLLARFRIGGSGNGDIMLATYDGTSWSNNLFYSDGSIPLPNRYSLYGGEKFLNGTFYSCFSIRYAQNNTITNPMRGYTLNSGLYFAETNSLPSPSSAWTDANGNSVSLPIGVPDAIKIAEPGDDYGTTTNPRTTYDPSFTVTENNAIHIVTQVDGINVHYYRGEGETEFSSASGGLIPDPEVRGDVFSYKDHVFMVELIGGKPVIKSTKEGTNDWKVVYSSLGEAATFLHFDAFIEGDKLYVYLMATGSGDARPLHMQIFELSEEDAPSENDPNFIRIEAEDYDQGGQNVGYFDSTAGNSGGVYRTDDVDIEGSDAVSNGYYVTNYAGNEWMQYTFNVATAGTYDFAITAANRNRDDSTMDIQINDVVYEDVLITRTFDWNFYLDTRIQDVELQQGTNTVRLTQRRALSSRIDKFEFGTAATLTAKDFANTTVAVFPNPSTGIFNITSNVLNLEYALVNIQGQAIEEGSVLNNKVDFSKRTSGIYFLRLSNNTGESFVEKLIIK